MLQQDNEYFWRRPYRKNQESLKWNNWKTENMMSYLNLDQESDYSGETNVKMKLWKEVKHIHVSAADLESNRKPWLVQIPEAATGGVPQKKGVL